MIIYDENKVFLNSTGPYSSALIRELQFLNYLISNTNRIKNTKFHYTFQNIVKVDQNMMEIL